MHFNITAKELNIPRQLPPGISSPRGFIIIIIITIIIIFIIIIIVIITSKVSKLTISKQQPIKEQVSK